MNNLNGGFHTGAFYTIYLSFWWTRNWAAAQGVQNLECGFVDGACRSTGYGSFPQLASWENPKMEESIGCFRSLLDTLGNPYDLGFLAGKDTPA